MALPLPRHVDYLQDTFTSSDDETCWGQLPSLHEHVKPGSSCFHFCLASEGCLLTKELGKSAASPVSWWYGSGTKGIWKKGGEGSKSCSHLLCVSGSSMLQVSVSLLVLHCSSYTCNGSSTLSWNFPPLPCATDSGRGWDGKTWVSLLRLLHFQ